MASTRRRSFSERASRLSTRREPVHPYPPPSTVPPLPPCPQGRLAALLGRLSRGLWALTSAEGLSSKGAAGRIQLRSLLRLMGVLLPLLSEEHQDMGVRQMLWAGT